jgi:tRNA modification GTPase
VTPIPGTTRDKVSETIQIEGVPAARDRHRRPAASDTHDEVERIGIARTWDAIARADALLFLRDLTRLGEPDYDAGDAAIAQTAAAGALAGRTGHGVQQGRRRRCRAAGRRRRRVGQDRRGPRCAAPAPACAGPAGTRCRRAC